MPDIPEVALMGLFFLLTCGIVALFSSRGWREIYTKAVALCEKVLMRPLRVQGDKPVSKHG